jgi:hypothetical protein
MPTIVTRHAATRNHPEYIDVRYMPRKITDANGDKYELVLMVDGHGRPDYRYRKISWLTKIFGK